MKFQVLVSTMNRDENEIRHIIKKSNLMSDVLVINQCGNEDKYKIQEGNQIITVVEKKERGLSKSRNCALMNSDADICLVADDDIYYESNIEQSVCKAFSENPQFDIIAFFVNRSSNFNKKEIGKKHRVNKFQSLGLMSVQIAFRRKNILEKGLLFDERFGAGSGQFICGEENIFLMDCINAGCKILYVPVKIASTDDSESSWFKGYNQLYFQSKGAVFCRLFSYLDLFMIYVFGILKINEYGREESLKNAIKYMKQGRRMIK